MADRHHLPADGGPPAWPPEQPDPLDEARQSQFPAGFHAPPAVWRNHRGAKYLPWEVDPTPHENERPPQAHRQIAMPVRLPEDGGPDGPRRMPWEREPGGGNGGPLPPARELDQPSGAQRMPWQEVPADPRAFDETEGLRIELEPVPGVTPKALLATNLIFQCPPMDEFGVSYAHTHNDYETVTKQLSRKNVPQLATFDFQTLAVDWGSYVVNKDTLDPRQYVYFVAWFREKLKAICLSGDPVHLTAWHGGGGVSFEMDRPLTENLGVEIDMDVTLRQVKVTEKSGEGDARYFDLSFVEYQGAEVARRGLGRVKKRKGSLLPTTVSFFPLNNIAVDSQARRVGEGRTITLALLAKHYYGDPSVARDIARWNHITGWPNSAPLKDYPPFKRIKKGHAKKLRLHTIDEAELVTHVVNADPGAAWGTDTGQAA